MHTHPLLAAVAMMLAGAAAPLFDRGNANANPAAITFKPPPLPTRESLAAAKLRREIAAWNAEVDRKKAAKEFNKPRVNRRAKRLRYAMQRVRSGR